MDHFLDEAARILASPMPRRQAFRLLGGALLAGIAGALGAKEAGAQTTCGGKKCKNNQYCCTQDGFAPFCVTTGKVCCGTKTCGPNVACCHTSPPFCVTPKKRCTVST